MECPVCLRDDVKEYGTLLCNHVVCSECIPKLTSQTKSVKCPLCRSRTHLTNIHISSSTNVPAKTDLINTNSSNTLPISNTPTSMPPSGSHNLPPNVPTHAALTTPPSMIAPSSMSNHPPTTMISTPITNPTNPTLEVNATNSSFVLPAAPSTLPSSTQQSFPNIQNIIYNANLVPSLSELPPTVQYTQASNVCLPSPPSSQYNAVHSLPNQFDSHQPNQLIISGSHQITTPLSAIPLHPLNASSPPQITTSITSQVATVHPPPPPPPVMLLPSGHATPAQVVAPPLTAAPPGGQHHPPLGAAPTLPGTQLFHHPSISIPVMPFVPGATQVVLANSGIPQVTTASLPQPITTVMTNPIPEQSPPAWSPLNTTVTVAPSIVHMSSASINQVPPPQQQPVWAVNAAGQPVVTPTHIAQRIVQASQVDDRVVRAQTEFVVHVAATQNEIIKGYSALHEALERQKTSLMQQLSQVQLSESARMQQIRDSCRNYAISIQTRDPASFVWQQWVQEQAAWDSALSSLSQTQALAMFPATQVVIGALDQSVAPGIKVLPPQVDVSMLFTPSSMTSGPSSSIVVMQNVNVVNLQPVGMKLIAHSASGTLRVWDYVNQRVMCEMNHPGLRTWSLFDSGSRVVIASSKIKIYDTSNGVPVASFDSIPSPAKRIITAGTELKARALSFHVNQGSAALWDLHQATRLEWSLDISHWNSTLATPISPGSHTILIPTMTYPYAILFFNMLTGDVDDQKLESSEEVVDIQTFTSAKGDFVVTLSAGGLISIINWKEKKSVISITLTESKYKNLHVQFIPGNSQLWPLIAAYSTSVGTFMVYNPNKNDVYKLTHVNSTLLSSSVRAVFILPDGHRAISAHATGKIHYWKLDSEQAYRTESISVSGQFILSDNEGDALIGTTTGFLARIDLQTGNILSQTPISTLDNSAVQLQRIFSSNAPVYK